MTFAIFCELSPIEIEDQKHSPNYDVKFQASLESGPDKLFTLNYYEGKIEMEEVPSVLPEVSEADFCNGHSTLAADSRRRDIAPLKSHITRPLSPNQASLRDWHEISVNGTAGMCTIEVSKDAAVVEIHLEDGAVTLCNGESIAGNINDRTPISLGGEENDLAIPLEALESMFGPIKGKTILYALWEPGWKKLYLLDIRKIGGVWLTVLPRLKRNRMLSRLIESTEDSSIVPLDLTLLSAFEDDDGPLPDDDDLARQAFGANCKLLCFSLDDRYMRGELMQHYYWVDPAAQRTYRVLSISKQGEQGEASYSANANFGLGLLEQEGGPEEYAFSINSSQEVELDSLVLVEGYLSLNLKPGDRVVLENAYIVEQTHLHKHASSAFVE